MIEQAITLNATDPRFDAWIDALFNYRLIEHEGATWVIRGAEAPSPAWEAGTFQLARAHVENGYTVLDVDEAEARRERERYE